MECGRWGKSGGVGEEGGEGRGKEGDTFTFAAPSPGGLRSVERLEAVGGAG